MVLENMVHGRTAVGHLLLDAQQPFIRVILLEIVCDSKML